MMLAAVLVFLAVGAWATGKVPTHLVSLAFFFLAVVLRVAPPSVVFSGFTSSALWLIFGGQIMGIAVQHTGLADRIANAAAHRMGSRGYASVVAGIVALGVGLSFVMPSAMGRVTLFMPIAMALADRYGFRDAGPGRHGLLLAATLGTGILSFSILPANVPNAVLLGAAEAQHGVSLRYLEYLVLHFPVLGAVRAVALVLLVVWLFPARLTAAPDAPRVRKPLSPEERKVCWLVGLALVLWATDSLHGIAPAWVSLGVAVVLLVPALRVVPPRAFEQLNLGPLFFVAGVIGVGAVLSHSGLSTVLAAAAVRVFPLAPGRSATNFASLAAVGSLLSIVTTAPGLPAVLTPLASSFASATGLPIRTVLMTEVLGFSNNLLPYQTAPVLVSLQLSDTPIRVGARLTLTLFVVTSLVLLPLDYLWWKLLAWL